MKDYTQFTDEALQRAALSGDSQAEEQLAMRYSRLVKACARPYFLAGGDSEDLTQEGMLGLLSAIREYDCSQNASFKTYAELCIKRRLYTAIKSASRMKHTPLNEGISLDDVMSDETLSVAPPFSRGPEEQVLARERADEITDTYKRHLSAFEARICELFLQGLSYREMAEITRRPEKSIDNAVQRIRRKLAQHPNLATSAES